MIDGKGVITVGIIKADGSRVTAEWPLPIPVQMIRDVVGGDEELVRVLVGDTYLTMAVHERGVWLNKPRNEQATELYYANWKRAFPDIPVSSAARVAHAKAKLMLGDVKRIDLNDGDPYVAGDAVVMPFPKEHAEKFVVYPRRGRR